jgi:two-component system sensor histidine kinase YesM
MNRKIKNKSFKKAMLLNIGVVAISIIFTLTIAAVSAAMHSRDISSIAAVFILEIAILLFSVLYFVKFVYKPIMKIDAAVHLLEDTQDELSFDLLQDDTPYISYTLNRMINLLKESMSREHALEILRKQAEISKLQSQINPHFLYNTLEAIRGEAIIQGNDEVAEMTEALANYFRYSISKKGDFVTLSEELKNVENYITIQKYRFDNRISFRIDYHTEQSIISQCFMPKLILQPIVENAIYHGLETKVGKGEVVIHITATEKRLIIVVSDDGSGIESELLDKINRELNSDKATTVNTDQRSSLGIAIININQRLKLLWGNEYGITLSSTLNMGTDAEITLPLVTDISLLKGGKA